MQEHRSGPGTELLLSPEGILFVSGFDTSVRIDRGHLAVRSGVGGASREARFPKITRPRLRRLVVQGSGSLSLSSLAWLDGIGASFVHLGRDGRLLATSARLGTNIPTLRRAAALAASTKVGLEIAKSILSRKLEGQRWVLERIEGSELARRDVERQLYGIEQAETLAAVLLAESLAASSVLVRLVRARGSLPNHGAPVGSRALAPVRSQGVCDCERSQARSEPTERRLESQLQAPRGGDSPRAPRRGS